MRRIVATSLLILLLAPACVTPRLQLPRIPVIGPVIIGGDRPAVPPPPPQPVQCAEISRIPCDFVHCQKAGYDFVTQRCTGKSGVTASCVQNEGCQAAKDTR